MDLEAALQVVSAGSAFGPGSAADVQGGHGIWGLTCGNARNRPDRRVSRR